MGMTRKEFLAHISETVFVETAAAFPGTGTATKIGTTIPVGKKRCIWWMMLESVDDTEQILEICQGDTTDEDRTTKMMPHSQDLAAGGSPTILGGDPEAPILVMDGVAAAGTSDEVRLAHETSAIKVSMAYYDIPL